MGLKARRWKLSAAGCCHGTPEGVGCTHQDVRAAGRRPDDKTGRPIRYQRLDLEQERWAPVLCLVKLEPLKEP